MQKAGFLITRLILYSPDPIDDEPFGENKACGRPRCQACRMITLSRRAKSSSGARIKVKGDTNCRTLYVVYLISCGKSMLGETTAPMNIRMNGHRDDWRRKKFENDLQLVSTSTRQVMPLLLFGQQSRLDRQRQKKS